MAGQYAAEEEANQKINDAYSRGIEAGEGYVTYKPPNANYSRVFGNVSGEHIYIVDGYGDGSVRAYNSSINITVLALKDKETDVEYFYAYIPRKTRV